MGRIKTGITKVDEYLGGFPEGRTILATGDPGAGKTIMGLQFANSCCAQGLKTVYLSTEEISDDLRAQAKSFNFNFEAYEKEGLLKFIDISVIRARELGTMMNLRFLVSKGNFGKMLDDVPEDTQTLIIDSIGGYVTREGTREFMDELDTLNYNLYSRGITTLMILDNATSADFSGLAMYSCYGAINLMKRDNAYTGKRERVMDIIKMRNSNTPIQLIPYEINVGVGIEIISIVE